MTHKSSQSDATSFDPHHDWASIDPTSYLVLCPSTEHALDSFRESIETGWRRYNTPTLVDAWPVDGEPKRWVTEVFEEQTRHRHNDVAYLKEVVETKPARYVFEQKFYPRSFSRVNSWTGPHIRVYRTEGKHLRGILSHEALTESFQNMDVIAQVDVADETSTPAAIEELKCRTWRITRENGAVESAAAGESPDDEVLEYLLDNWTHGRALGDWSDWRTFAGICYRETTFSLREIVEMTGLSPAEIRNVSVPDGPPWELDDPRGPGSLRITKEMGKQLFSDPADSDGEP